MIARGQTYLTRHNGKTIAVVALEIEQTGTHRGKWACRRVTGARRMWRTERQLYSVHAPPLERRP